MVTAKDCHILTSYYEKKYKERYDAAPVVNHNKARWGFDSILRGMSVVVAKELIDYWFETNNLKRHDLEWLFYNYDKLIVIKQEQTADKEHRQKMASESAVRAAAWRARGNKTITGE